MHGRWRAIAPRLASCTTRVAIRFPFSSAVPTSSAICSLTSAKLRPFWSRQSPRPAGTGVADVRVTGVDDPRSSGLGNWRDQKGLSFAEVKEQIADDVCTADEKGERIATLVVHDANLGAIALQRGCTDLVLAGHLHVQKGPTRVVGANGKAGYTYTNGTTGGAAYAIAIGSKLRRDAEFTFVTYRDGRPVGIQPVTVTTTGAISVAPYIELDLG